MTIKNKQKGFTLIELMVVIAIIGVLAGFAIPQYGQYAKKAKFQDVIARAIPYKMAVGECAQDNNSLILCDSGYRSITSINSPVGQVQSLSVTNGSITATGTPDIGSAVYKLNPTYNSTDNTLTWSVDYSMAKDCRTMKVCN